MRDLPSGTVTFLFTDIEGSTKLVQELGDDYSGALAAHRQVLRQAFTEHGGAEVDTQGDAFLIAFVRAKDAVLAAADAQQALGDGPIRVRFAECRDEGRSMPLEDAVSLALTEAD
jgi:class 3 adenylate cyclase